MGRSPETGKALGLCLMTALVAMQYALGIPEWMADGGWRCALTHHFFHVNWLHLAINCYAVWMIFRRGITLWHIPTAFALGTLAYFTALSPTIGMSNMLYALIGLRSPSYCKAWWKHSNTIIFLCVMVAYLFIPKVSALTHIVSFAGGIAIGFITYTTRTTRNDYVKATSARRRQGRGRP